MASSLSVHQKYLALPMGLFGRGGAITVFSLAAGADYSDELVTFPEWGAGVKQQVVESGEHPAGVLPVVTIGDSKYIEHVAICRYIARRLGLYGKDAERDYQADAYCDTYVTWRDAWANTFTADEAGKAAYSKQRAEFYKVMEALAVRFGAEGAHLLPGDELTHADALVFTLIYDDCITHGEELLEDCPRLRAFKSAFAALQPVEKQIASHQSSSHPGL